MAQATLQQAGSIGTALAASRSVNTVITPLPTTIPQAQESTLQSMGLARRLSAYHSSQNWEGRWQNVSGGQDEDAKFRSFLRLEEWLQRRLRAKLTPMIGRFAIALAFAAQMANASPVDPGQVEVLDGDTIRIAGETFRLVGFDAPETYRARCPSERDLGNLATFRVRQLVAAGGLDLERIACSCPTGTEGTLRCNYGRSCGILRARGQDVGALLIAEDLARACMCGRTSCPTRKAWCLLTP
jgi:endonuclease YncB( thermonuclease family)